MLQKLLHDKCPSLNPFCAVLSRCSKWGHTIQQISLIRLSFHLLKFSTFPLYWQNFKPRRGHCSHLISRLAKQSQKITRLKTQQSFLKKLFQKMSNLIFKTTSAREAIIAFEQLFLWIITLAIKNVCSEQSPNLRSFSFQPEDLYVSQSIRRKPLPSSKCCSTLVCVKSMIKPPFMQFFFLKEVDFTPSVSSYGTYFNCFLILL